MANLVSSISPSKQFSHLPIFIGFPPMINVNVYRCERFHRYIFDKTIWNSNSCYSFLGFTCSTCGDSQFCGRKEKRRLDRYGLNLNKEFKTGMMLFYDEEGITDETQIGRFKFKLKRKEEDGKQTVED